VIISARPISFQKKEILSTISHIADLNKFIIEVNNENGNSAQLNVQFPYAAKRKLQFRLKLY
jgi:hypothetical protein